MTGLHGLHSCLGRMRPVMPRTVIARCLPAPAATPSKVFCDLDSLARDAAASLVRERRDLVIDNDATPTPRSLSLKNP
jgi:hypothetical protein